MASGIRDKVAIVGMGCTRFGERWDVGADGLMVEAFAEALAEPGAAHPDNRDLVPDPACHQPSPNCRRASGAAFQK